MKDTKKIENLKAKWDEDMVSNEQMKDMENIEYI